MLPRATTLLILTGLLLGELTPAAAQLPTATFDFRAVGASVAEGATNVPLSLELTFTLSNPLPTDDLLDRLGFEDLEALLLETGGADVISAATNDARTEITYQLSLSADQDHGIGLWGLKYDFDGDLTPPVDFSYVFQPFAVNFTTAATIGDATVQGTLRLDPNQFPDEDPDFTNAFVVIGTAGSDDLYLDVVEDAGNTFSIGTLRGGLQVVTAVTYGTELVAGVPTIRTAVGYYDADGNGNPDFVTVGDGGTATADIIMDTYFTEVGTAAEDRPAVAGTALGANAPNPVRTRSTITYHLSTPQPVRLAVYDLLGREVVVLADGLRPPGTHAVVFDAAGLPSGLYLYRLETDQQAQTRSLVVTR